MFYSYAVAFFFCRNKPIMSELRNYRDLITWQMAMELAKEVYRTTMNFPKEERYRITSQIRRSAVSVPSNVAEGHSRNSTGEYRQQLGVANGSLAELETLVLLSTSFTYLSEEEGNELLKRCSEVGKLLNGILRSL